jgi:transcriptional regulator with PAS, ATPase and Fis domain
MVIQGNFRRDLYYRLNVIPLELPPLRERGKDVLLQLINKFIDGSGKRISPEAMKKLLAYDWPGNIRELKNMLSYLSVIVEEEEITVADLPSKIQFNQKALELYPKHYNPKSVAEAFSQKGELSDFLLILKSLENAPQGTGRNKLVKLLREQQLLLSETKIRGYLNLMARFGCVSIGVTRQGTVITEQGKAIISYLESISNRELTEQLRKQSLH